MPPLPPLTQPIAINAADFVAGINEIIGTAQRAAEAITEVITSIERLVGAEADSGGAAKGAADAQAGLAEATKAAASEIDIQVRQLQLLADIDAQVIETNQVLAESLIAEADAMRTLRDATATEGDAAATAAGKTGLLAGHGKMMFLGLAVGAALALHAAGDYQAATTRLVTSAGESTRNLAMVQSDLLSMSVQTNTSLSQLSSGMYIVESAGFHGAQGLQVLRAAAEGAQAEGAQLATVSNAVTSALNAYGLKSSAAMRITNMMVSAVAHGKMTMQDFSASLANVLPVAAAAHIGFAQVAGAIATMTAQGLSAANASQLLRHTIVALQNPNSVQIAEMQQLGINSIQLSKNIGKLGLTGAISGLEETILKQMGPSGLVLLKAFNQSKIAAQSAQEMIAAMPPALAKVAKGYADGSISISQWNSIIRKSDLSTLQVNLLKQFATVENASKGFNNQLKAGGADAQTFTAALSKVMGGAEGLQVALMTGDGHMATFRANTKAIGQAGADTGKNIDHWALIQKEFNFQLGAAVKGFEAAGTALGMALLPAVTAIIHPIASFLALVAQSRTASVILATVVGTVLAYALGTKLVGAFSNVKSGVESLGAGVTFLAGKFGLLTVAEETQTAATEAATVATGEMDAAMDANPIGAIILLVAALAVGLYELYRHCALVREIVHDVGQAFAVGWHMAMQLAGQAITAFEHGPLKTIEADIAQFRQWWAQNHQQIEQITERVWTTIKDQVLPVVEAMFGMLKGYVDIWVGFWKASWDIVSGFVVTAWHIIADTIEGAVRSIEDIISIALDIIHGHWSAAWHDLEDLAQTGMDTIHNVIMDAVKGFGSMLYNAGQALLQGLANGIKSMVGSLMSLVKSVGSSIVNAAKSALGIHSPSTVMATIGQEIGAGLIQGLEGTRSDVKSAAGKIASIVAEAVRGNLITSDQGSAITAWVERDNRHLQMLATEREHLLKRIQAAERFAHQTTQTLVSSASLTSIASAIPSGGAVTSGTILSGLQLDLTHIREFGAAIRKLRAAGLDRSLLMQIIQAGPDQGLQIAQALLDGPVSEIRKMNQAENAINNTARNIGKESASMMYDSGKHAGEGFLSGLRAQQKAIDALMAQIAKTMVARLRKDLGISSPSMVAHWHGLMFAQGLAAGLDDGRHLVDSAAARLSGSLRVHPGTFNPVTGGSAAGGTQINVQIDVHVAAGFVGSNQELATALAKAVQPALLQLQKRNPTNQLP